MAGKIFINYRRDDAPGVAAQLYDRLSAHFGRENLFIDVDNIVAGQRFDVVLREALASTDVFLCVIGPRWMEAHIERMNSAGRDYVCEEIAEALERGIPVIPVRIGREGRLASFPRAEELPAPLQGLFRYQGFAITHERFESDVARLADAILQTRGGGAGGGKLSSFPFGTVLAAGAAVAGASVAVVASPTIAAAALGAAAALAAGAAGRAAMKSLSKRRSARERPSDPAPEEVVPADSHEPPAASDDSTRRPRDVVETAGDFGGDRVHCSVYSPPRVGLSETFMVQVFLHLFEDAERATQIATAFDASAGLRGGASLSLTIPRGTKVAIALEAGDLVIPDAVQELVWNGSPEPRTFLATVPHSCRHQSLFAVVRVSVGGVPVGRIAFKVEIEAGEKAEAIPMGEPLAYRSVFCSYSSRDIETVARCTQLLKALRFDCFHDKGDLVPGSVFELELLREIEKRDLFLLFWSYSAQESEWVLKEAQHAATARFLSPRRFPDIIPIVIDGPPPPAPPEFLKHLHFDDKHQYMVAALKAAALGKSAST